MEAAMLLMEVRQHEWVKVGDTFIKFCNDPKHGGKFRVAVDGPAEAYRWCRDCNNTRRDCTCKVKR